MTVEQRIIKAIQEDIQPIFLDVLNESDGHNVPKGSETHFKVVVVADKFDGVSKVKRHQEVYSVLSAELESGVHALAMHLYSPSEWDDVVSVKESPHCLGGSKAV